MISKGGLKEKSLSISSFRPEKPNVLRACLVVILETFLIFLTLENFYHSSVRKTRNIL